MPLSTALAIALAAYSGTLGLSDRSEARVRATIGQPPTAIDLETLPLARIDLRTRRWEHWIQYGPRFTLRDLESSDFRAFELLHTGALGTAWHDRFVRLSLDETGSYGKQNFAYLTGTGPQQAPTTPSATQGAPTPPPVAVQRLPPLQSITIANSTTTLGAQLRPARRWYASLSIGYTLGGGVDEASRSVLPFQSGPNAFAGVDYAVTRRDHAVASVVGTRRAFSHSPCPVLPPAVLDPNNLCAPQSDLVDASAGWLRHWTRSTDTQIVAGASFVHDRLKPEERYRFRVMPVVAATTVHKFEGAAEHPRGILDLRLAPIVDRTTGIVTQRVQATVEARWLREHTELHVTVGAAQTIDAPAVISATFVQGEIGALRHTTRRATVEVGVRGAWQKPPEAPAIELVGLYVAFGVRAPETRF